jgi:hypothetical protein
MFGNSLYIGRRKKWTGGFTAIGTFQTVRPLKFGMVQVLHHVIQILGRFLLQFAEIFFILGILLPGQTRQLF